MATANDDRPAAPAEPGPRKPMEYPPSSLISISAEERRRRAESAREMWARMDAIKNGPDEDDAEFFRALDESTGGRLNLARHYTDGPDPA